MFTRLMTTVGLSGVAFGAALLAPASADAARQAICEHPEGSACVAKKDTGRVQCQCLDGEVEVRRPELTGANEEELMDACWEAWTDSCAPWSDRVTCEEPSRGKCEVTPNGGGMASCFCDVEGEVERTDLAALTDLDDDALEQACYVQIDDLCSAAAPEPTPAPPAPTATAPEPTPAASCSVTASAPAPWLWVALFGFGAIVRRRNA
ncbi:MAG: MYXO-CTERM sorting domain-containing protein [Myxococcota bacterium]